MKKLQIRAIVFTPLLLVAACSAQDAGTPRLLLVEEASQHLDSVPEDGSDFQAEATIDATGSISGRRVTRGVGTIVTEIDPAALAPKPNESERIPTGKISLSLAAKLRAHDNTATTEVVVSVRHDAPFSLLPKLRRDQPRTSTENQQRLATRVAEIAAVDSRRKPFRDAVVAHARALGAVISEELTMGNAVAMTIPDAAAPNLASHPNVLEVIPRYDGTPPPSTISDGTSQVTGMNSDFWRPGTDGGFPTFYMVAFDTGVRSSHTVFNSPDRGILDLHRDCSRGNSSCVNSPVNADYDDQDTFWNHGTGATSIMLGGNSAVAGFGLPFRGVSKPQTFDYLNVYSDAGSDAVAVGRAFLLAATFSDDLIVAELQMTSTESGAPSLAADDAFDQGIAVLGACGNTGTVAAPASPGNAHKALSVGDYDAVHGSVSSQVPGLVGGRIKPDFQAPTAVDAAGNGSNTSKRTNFGGTSGATAFGGGAAAIMYEWYNAAFGLSNKPGNLYTALLAQGDAVGTPTTPNGAGKLKMESGSQWWTGSVTLGASAIDITIGIPSGRKDMKVAIWWPESQADLHNDVDLRLFSPGGAVMATSTSGGSVWEKIRTSGNLAAGNYKVRLTPFSMPRPSQVVYYTVIASYQ